MDGDDIERIEYVHPEMPGQPTQHSWPAYERFDTKPWADYEPDYPSPLEFQ